MALIVLENGKDLALADSTDKEGIKHLAKAGWKLSKATVDDFYAKKPVTAESEQASNEGAEK